MFAKKKLKQSLADKYNLYRETGETPQGLRGSAGLPENLSLHLSTHTWQLCL